MTEALSNVSEGNQPAPLMQIWLARNDCEQRDKHLAAHLIPISLTIVEQQAAPIQPVCRGSRLYRQKNGPAWVRA
jgi:hypothetical protein